jgi:F-type H+-transporting ATPase subunit epsilon
MAQAASTSTFRLQVVTPQRVLVSEDVTELVAPGSEGFFGVLPGHLPFVTTLKAGELTYWKGGEERHLAVCGGYAQVGGEGVRVLADAAETAEEVDVERAERARQRAEQRIQAWSVGDESADFTRAQAALLRALARLDVARKGH